MAFEILADRAAARGCGILAIRRWDRADAETLGKSPLVCRVHSRRLTENAMEILDLTGRKGLVVGIANEHSLAWAAAQRFRRRSRDYLPALRCKSAPGELDEVFDAIRTKWGGLDLLFHAIGWAPRQYLRGRLTDCSAEGFAEAMLVSCHSFIRMAKLTAPLMAQGGSLITLSYYGAEKVVDHYNVMGLVKAALEASVRYLAHELGAKNIRVNAISAGAVETRAAVRNRAFR